MAVRQLAAAGALALALSIIGPLRADLPSGVTFDEQNGIRFSGAIARELNTETRSFDRDKYIASYVNLLQSAEPAERAWAACALGQFQSETAVQALLKRIGVESHAVVLQKLHDELNNLFEVYGFPPSPPVPKITLVAAQQHAEQWRGAYEKLGYLGLARHGWEVAKSRGTDAAKFFVCGLSGRYDPQLVKILLEIAESREGAAVKRAVHDLILCWSGYDLEMQSVANVKSELAATNALSSSTVCERYHSYVNRLGYGGATKDIRMAAVQRAMHNGCECWLGMAERLASCP